MSKVKQATTVCTEVYPVSTSMVKNLRVGVIDELRGVIMILMALCHCRDYIGGDYYENLEWNTSPLWKGSTALEFFQQAFCSMIAAGGFFMLMGVSMAYFWNSRSKDSWSNFKMTKYLMMRGAILIILQLTLLQAFEIFTEGKILFYAGVLMSLGFCMIVSAALLSLISVLEKFPRIASFSPSYLLPALSALIIIVVTHIIITQQALTTDPAIWKILFFIGGEYQRGIYLDINFPLLSWFPAVAIGLMIGQLMLSYKEESFKIIKWIACLMLIAFLILRFANLHQWLGLYDYKQIITGEPITFLSYFSVSKYPPSIAYYLWALGFNLLLLSILQLTHRLSLFDKILQPIKIFGQCALFFFILHWFVYYGLSFIFNKPDMTTENIIGVWLFGVLILYPLCVMYNRFKLSTPKESLWRMF